MKWSTALQGPETANCKLWQFIIVEEWQTRTSVRNWKIRNDGTSSSVLGSNHVTTLILTRNNQEKRSLSRHRFHEIILRTTEQRNRAEFVRYVYHTTRGFYFLYGLKIRVSNIATARPHRSFRTVAAPNPIEADNIGILRSFFFSIR